jgi:hypothetical protein
MSADRRRRRDRRRTPLLPPPPPGIEKLRAARAAVEPDRVYALAMPAGGVFMARGSDLLETAGALVDPADASESGDEARLRDAFSRLGFGQDPSPGSSIVLCTKVGHARCAIPSGYLTADCSRCGAAVWVSPGSHALVASGCARPVCNGCIPSALPADVAPAPGWPPSAGRSAEPADL